MCYERKQILRKEACKLLNIGKTRFSEIYQIYKQNPDSFKVDHKRDQPNRKLNTEADKLIATKLRSEKTIIEDTKITTVNKFNFNAIRDEIQRNHKKKISKSTIRNKAILWGFYKPKEKKTKAYIEFETGGFGVLWQHDTSIHQWSPFMNKFYLIMTIDDHSRYIIAAKFFAEEKSIGHIYAIEEAVMCFGIPISYYVDRHSIFTGHDRNGIWNKSKKQKEDFEVQFKMVCALLKINIIEAKSANAKGKIERPFAYFQDRLTRRCAKEEVKNLTHAQRILDEEIEFYNCHRIHSTTGEIPLNRMQKSFAEKTAVVRKFDTEKHNHKDIFCLHHKRSVDKFLRISYSGILIKLKNVYYRQRVDVHVRIEDNLQHLRIFGNGKHLKNQSIPVKKIRNEEL